MGTIEKMFLGFGTVNSITAHFSEPERDSVRMALDAAENYINTMDDRLSVFKPESLISRINANAGLLDTLVDRETFDLLRVCKEYGGLTGGVFDITTKPLTDAGKPARVDYHDILLDEERLSVRLRRRGQGIHLGGIAKGWAVDRVVGILEHGGVENAVINLGGTVRNIGISRKIGVRNPFKAESIALYLESEGEAVVTSGLYERGSHIYDPFSGKPAVSDLASATVIGKDGAAADTAATACMILGTAGGVKLLALLGLEGVFILRNGGILATSNIRERVRPVSFKCSVQ